MKITIDVELPEMCSESCQWFGSIPLQADLCRLFDSSLKDALDMRCPKCKAAMEAARKEAGK